MREEVQGGRCASPGPGRSARAASAGPTRNTRRVASPGGERAARRMRAEAEELETKKLETGRSQTKRGGRQRKKGGHRKLKQGQEGSIEVSRDDVEKENQVTLSRSSHVKRPNEQAGMADRETWRTRTETWEDR